MNGKEKQSSLTYEIVESGDQTGIKCLVCGMTSYNPNDVANKYCGHCHRFHEEMQASSKPYRKMTYIITVVVEYKDDDPSNDLEAAEKAAIKFASNPSEFYYWNEWASKEEYLKDLW